MSVTKKLTRGTSTNALGIVTILQVTMDTTDRELKAGLGRARLGLATGFGGGLARLGFAATFAGHSG